jgi:hypothetical protein
MQTKYTKTEVHYRHAVPGAKRRCFTCLRFRHARCWLVAGEIDEDSVCNIWKFKSVITAPTRIVARRRAEQRQG